MGILFSILYYFVIYLVANQKESFLFPQFGRSKVTRGIGKTNVVEYDVA